MNPLKRVRGNAGFTLVELLVVLAIGAILALVSYPELAKYYTRSQLEGTTQQLSLVMQKARYQAIKTRQATQVCADTANRRVLSTSTTLLPQVELPKAIRFGAPAPQAAITVTANCFTFNSDGSVTEAGSFRLVDQNSNYLEVRVEPQATARVQVRKWDATDSQWYTRNQGGKSWQWNTNTIF
ncbi:MAG TPA: GspH/FimT family pseudopilin [Thermoanaerobaculia bacterium]|jgi:prepilin-type N-terminal cleavage/methylation domain-containing protein|nr:GspH/FimT family pseudopilin [Thermoanaerobaculia bacterium]